jgi:hypothetical protein
MIVSRSKERDTDPWSALRKASEDGLRRIAAACESSYLDEKTGRTISTFGISGPAVAKEIYLFLDTASDKVPKKAKPNSKAEDSEEKKIEVALISAFIKLSKEKLSTPPIVKWGTDRIHIRNAIRSGWNPQDIEYLMEVYFDNCNDNYTFLKGDIKSFISSLQKLTIIKNQKPKSMKVTISEDDLE